MFAAVRLKPLWGGDPNAVPITVAFYNDSGSTVQTLLPVDIHLFGPTWDTYLTVSQVSVRLATGVVTMDSAIVHMQILDYDGTPLTPFFDQRVVVNRTTDTRLSGNQMRNHLYFATAPGIDRLYVAAKKNGIVSQLPVV
ncbi:hypothetical protein SPI_06858 [Niveomyces insectorum RCEF 264]|uniref:Uncharacterized protein n=1 Tax=Niveomyces insectorum RCEF 264 TaxID=1081102 RepID=A0A167QUB0_9HYPO|nr:hypothetical protein SPI_06858 [Niveomyces insectorum RCEF 264]